MIFNVEYVDMYALIASNVPHIYTNSTINIDTSNGTFCFVLFKVSIRYACMTLHVHM